MSETTLSREVALRIGLAARELEDTDAARLLKVLSDLVGLPPTDASLSRLRPKQLKNAPGGELAGQTQEALQTACEILNGERLDPSQLPETQAYTEGDMPDSLRVACASNCGELINGHFASCNYFLIYQVSAEEIRLVEVRLTERADEAPDRSAFRASLIADAQVLFVASIGGPAAAKVVRAGVHPVKHPQGGHARDQLAELQSKIATAPPPWLAKAMGHAAQARVRFSTQGLEA